VQKNLEQANNKKKIRALMEKKYNRELLAFRELEKRAAILI